MTLLKTPIAKELDELKKLVNKRAGTSKRKRLREFIDGVLTIIVGLGLYDLLLKTITLIWSAFK